MTRTAALFAACALISLPAGVLAQTVSASFAELPGKVKIGQRVIVTDSNRQSSKGRLLRVDASGLSLEIGGHARDFADKDVQVLALVEHRATGWGAAIGAGTGLGFGFWMAQALRDCGECENNDAPFIRMLFMGLGAAAGSAIQWLIPHSQVVYVASGRAVSMAPLVTPTGLGAVLTVRF